MQMILPISDSHWTFEKTSPTFFVVKVQILKMRMYLKFITAQNFYYMFFHFVTQSSTVLH